MCSQNGLEENNKPKPSSDWLLSRSGSGTCKVQNFYILKSSKMRDLFMFFSISRTNVLCCRVWFLTLISASSITKKGSFKMYHFHYLRRAFLSPNCQYLFELP